MLQRTEEVAERGISISMYTHEATGAQVMLVDAPDANKVFSANFRTLPKDSTGVPHILEHSVLCGSKRYPSKEPFVDLLKGSLKTFLNAMTGADRTMYPVASQNKQDFFNLVNVYLDACLNPRILEPEHGPRILEQAGLGLGLWLGLGLGVRVRVRVRVRGPNPDPHGFGALTLTLTLALGCAPHTAWPASLPP